MDIYELALELAAIGTTTKVPGGSQRAMGFIMTYIIITCPTHHYLQQAFPH